MYTSVPAEKKPNLSFSAKNAKSDKKPLTSQSTVKKPNVRSADYRILMQIVLANTDSMTPEEFLFLQSAIGYRETMNILIEGKRRKQLTKMGMPEADVRLKPIQTEKQEAGNLSSSNGLPDNLKNGLENLSGVSLDDVKVHKNSEKPQEVGALAYTQGTHIYIAPGQEKHLPHEGWHAVQQKQGRIESTLQMKSGAFLNDDTEPEREADVMGTRAEKEGSESYAIGKETFQTRSTWLKDKVIQRKVAEISKKPKLQAGKVKLYAPSTGYETEVDSGSTETINYLKSLGYSEKPPEGKQGKADWVLKVGRNNNTNDIIVLQKVLVLCEYLDMPIDPATKKHELFGTYGELTRQAVIKMQKKNGLKQDGIVGPITWRAFPLPWDDVNNQPNRYVNKYQLILKNNNIYMNDKKVIDDPDIRYSKLYDQGLKKIEEGANTDKMGSTTLGVGEFRAIEGGRYVLSLDKYKNIKDPAARVYCAWNATQPELRIPVLKLNGSTYFASDFLIQLKYLYYRKQVDVTKLEVWQLDKIYETVHFDKIGMISAGVDAAASIAYNIAKGVVKYGDDIASIVSKGMPEVVETKYAKTSFWERITTKKVSIDKLVGNPKDEFMSPKIGYSETALSKHINYIKQNGTIDEPILVKKLMDGTYEIQNGHHRWLAAQKMGLNEVPVEVMK
ncbi:MAG: hypothetical protein K0R50_267 [Eubacterium sp.]|nr:hypothetical protein [Eubacterium sp.]